MSNNIIELQMGDPSGDGHKQAKSFLISTTFSFNEIRAAYQAGVEKVGLDITSTCEEYEDNKLSIEQIKLLEKAGLDPYLFFDYYYMSENNIPIQFCNISPDEFAEVYLFIATIGNPDFRYEEFNTKVIDIGGYGLFL